MINITHYIDELNIAADRIDTLMDEPKSIKASVQISRWTDHVRYIAGKITKEIDKEKEDGD